MKSKIVFLAAALLLVGCAEPNEEMAPQAIPVRTVTVAVQTVPNIIELPGRVEPVRVAEVRARVTASRDRTGLAPELRYAFRSSGRRYWRRKAPLARDLIELLQIRQRSTRADVAQTVSHLASLRAKRRRCPASSDIPATQHEGHASLPRYRSKRATRLAIETGVEGSTRSAAGRRSSRLRQARCETSQWRGAVPYQALPGRCLPLRA